MRLITYKSYEEMSDAALRIVESQLLLKPDSVIGLATGSTPIGLYQRLADKYSKGEIDFSGVKTFNLDEYYPIAPEHDQSYYYFMNKHLYSKVNLKPENINIPNGNAQDAEEECKNYECRIAAAGFIDLQVLGIGGNGHIGFNEPGEFLYPHTHKTTLTPETIAANARFFEDASQVPKEALTMGMQSILSSRKIILLANGENKRPALEALISGKITTNCPASLLNLHKDTTILTDIPL